MIRAFLELNKWFQAVSIQPRIIIEVASDIERKKITDALRKWSPSVIPEEVDLNSGTIYGLPYELRVRN